MPERTEPISFRLAATFARQLAESAAKHGQSPGEHARHLVVSALTDSRHDELRAELAELRAAVVESRDDLAALRDDVATGCVAILVTAGKLDAAEAEGWVRQNLSK
jgi:hypothetical protein